MNRKYTKNIFVVNFVVKTFSILQNTFKDKKKTMR